MRRATRLLDSFGYPFDKSSSAAQFAGLMATTLLSPVVVGRVGCGSGAGKSAAVAVCQRTVQSSSAALRSAKLRSLSGVAVCEGRASRSLTCSRRALRCKAAAVESSDSSSGDSALGGTLYLGLLFALWYAANIFFNIWNKQVLKAYAFPITGTFVQFFIGSCIAGAMWLLRIKEAPKVRVFYTWRRGRDACRCPGAVPGARVQQSLSRCVS